MNMENKITKVFVCEECAGVVQPCVLTMVAADRSDPVPDTCPQGGSAKWRSPQDKTPAAPTPEGETTPTWCKAKVCEYTWRKCEEELCCFDRRSA